jgi:hypothetical protein
LEKGEQLNMGDYKRAMEAQDLEAPASGSTESDFEKLTQTFITELQEMGQGIFDVKVTNLPDLIERQRTELDGTLSYAEPRSMVNGMTENEFNNYAEWQAEYNDALYANDPARLERAAIELEKARMAALNPDYGVLDPINIDRQYTRASMSGYGFFTGNGNPFTKNDDERANSKLFDIISGAVISGDATQIQQATTVMDIFDRAPMDIREEWDKNNTLNSAITDSRGISDLLAALNRLVSVTEENGNAHYTFQVEE